MKRGGMKQRVARDDAAVGHQHAGQPVFLVDDELLDGALDDADGASKELGPLDVGQDLGCEVDEVVWVHWRTIWWRTIWAYRNAPVFHR
jgi:hypothetical protein